MNILTMILEVIIHLLLPIAIIGEIIDIYMIASDKWKPTRAGTILRDITIIMWIMNSL